MKFQVLQKRHSSHTEQTLTSKEQQAGSQTHVTVLGQSQLAAHTPACLVISSEPRGTRGRGAVRVAGRAVGVPLSDGPGLRLDNTVPTWASILALPLTS